MMCAKITPQSQTSDIGGEKTITILSDDLDRRKEEIFNGM
jgi:hypothetical protein